MKTFKVAACALAAAFALTFTACDEEEDGPKKSNTELLTESEWKGSDIFYDGISYKDSSATEININTLRLKFDTTGIYTISDHENSRPETWKFLNHETQLVLGGDTAAIKLLTKDKLQFMTQDEPLGQENFDLEVHFTH